MLTERVQSALIDQVNLELTASYNYLGMSAYCEQQNLVGFAHWFRLQSQEEYSHAMKIYEFLIARNCPVKFKPIAAPRTDFESIREVFTDALEQEIMTSRHIDALYELALQEKNFAALVELQWFIAEQVEEEHLFHQIISKLDMVDGDPSGLLDLDRELGERSATAPPAESS